MHVRIGVGVVLVGWQLQYLSSRRGAGAGACLLAEEALKDWAGRTVGHEVAFFAARGSNVEGEDPFDGGEGDRREVPRRNLGRCGERGRQEAVERLQRVLRLGWEQRPWRSQAGPRSCELRSACWLLLDPFLEAGSDPAWY